VGWWPHRIATRTQHALEEKSTMKRYLWGKLIIGTLTAFVLGILVTPLAWAANPRFSQTNAGFAGSGADLNVGFTEVGLGANEGIDYLVSASATAVYVCLNGGGHNPSAGNKHTVYGPVEATATYFSDQNGRITNSLVLHPPGPGSFSCPNGQRLILASIMYEDDPIYDLTNGVTQTLPGPYIRTFFP
jgi:hypothetical protein